MSRFNLCATVSTCMCMVEEGNERKEMKELCSSGFDTLMYAAVNGYL